MLKRRREKEPEERAQIFALGLVEGSGHQNRGGVARGSSVMSARIR